MRHGGRQCHKNDYLCEATKGNEAYLMLTLDGLGKLLAQSGHGTSMTESEMEALCAQYPYFHAAQLYKAVLAERQREGGEKRSNAVLTPDRLVLYSLVHGAPCDYEAAEEGQLEEAWETQIGSAESLELVQEHGGVEDGEGELTACADRDEASENREGGVLASQEPTAVVEVQEDEAPVQETLAVAIEREREEGSVEAEKGEKGAFGEAVPAVEVESAVAASDLEMPLETEVAATESVSSDEATVEALGEAEGAAVEASGESEDISQGESGTSDSGEAPTLDLRGVLEFSLSQEVPGMAPSLSTFSAADFNLTQKDIDYINTHLNPQRDESAEEQEDGVAIEEERQSQAQRIDSFIENFDSILSKVLREEREAAGEGVEPEDLSESQQQLDTHIASERLAFLLAEKGEYGVAIPMYERLQAQNPKKSSYFAEIIARLRRREEENQ